MAEIQEKYVLLTRTSIKKIPLPKVLNKDSTGYPSKNIMNIDRSRRRFKVLARQRTHGPQNRLASQRSTSGAAGTKGNDCQTKRRRIHHSNLFSTYISTTLRIEAAHFNKLSAKTSQRQQHSSSHLQLIFTE